MADRIEAAANWLMADDTAYKDEPDAARRAAKEMLDAADLADEESIGLRLAKAQERAIAILNDPPGANRQAFIDALSAEMNLPADDKLAACADRILSDLYIRGYIVRLNVMEDAL